MSDTGIGMPPTPAARPVVPPATREAVLFDEADLPFVDMGDGSTMQLLQVDLAQGIWVVRMRFQPGFSVATHYHTGPVFAVTSKGEWRYLEYPDQISRSGSYLFEPAGAVHTLEVPKEQVGETEVWFAIFGANVSVDANGDVTGIMDANTVLEVYKAFCRREGVSGEKVLVLGA